MLHEAKNYSREAIETEVLPHLQHFGGNTNLIDFTTDYLIALFFACDGAIDDDGRLIFLDKRKATEVHCEFQHPVTPQNRVLAQKSVFVKSPTGYIDIDPDCVITIPAYLKTPMLKYLRKHHAISLETIYNDLHGFIRVQQLHQNAYAAFARGIRCYHQRDFETAIAHYTEALRRHPQFAKAYLNLGVIYEDQDDYSSAIRCYDHAIVINPDFDLAHFNRGLVHNKLGKYDQAIRDLGEAIRSNPNLSDAHFNRALALLHMHNWSQCKSRLNYRKGHGH